ncbi:MAG: eukaryotic-like serine/threonine-protein kinase [Solirubrobacteraceae bacterium]|nr:eukaryotic-like serine/threonine-protein kinase [Solirubrobacteraceae bacterium]
MGDIAPGAVLGEDRYTLGRRLGAGGMASVWLAQDGVLARPVAVKVIADTLAFDERYRERFAREARAAASVSHPGIVPVYDYGLHGERPFLVMEYVPGGSLADVLAGRRSLTLEPGELARELLGALDCVHGTGLVHRDVKPANILLDANGHARLTDFGIAQPEDATSLTQTGMVVGTVRYLAPEVAAGARATPAADLYAAGVVLRELAERRPAPELAALIAALTAPGPGDRPSSAATALTLLDTGPTEVLGGPAEAVPATAATRIAPAPAPSPSPQRRPTRPTRSLGRDPARRPPPAGMGPGGRRLPPRSALAVAAVLALAVVVILIASSSGGGSGSPGTRSAAPAPASAAAPLADQLRSLGQLVDRAARP